VFFRLTPVIAFPTLSLSDNRYDNRRGCPVVGAFPTTALVVGEGAPAVRQTLRGRQVLCRSTRDAQF
jgi:hypothetical protein